MKLPLLYFVLLLVVLGTGSCATEEEALEAIRAGALLVDVRTPGEFNQGALEDALNISHEQIVSRVAELGDDKDRSIVVYCRSGNRSGQAKKALEALGFTQVINGGSYEKLKSAWKD